MFGYKYLLNNKQFNNAIFDLMDEAFHQQTIESILAMNDMLSFICGDNM